MNTTFFERFRCPEECVSFFTPGPSLAGKTSAFPCSDSDLQCKTWQPLPNPEFAEFIRKVHGEIKASDGKVDMRFDLDSLVNCLRLELYTGHMREDETRLGTNRWIRALYYWARPFLPVSVRSKFQRAALLHQPQRAFPSWPVDRTVDDLLEQTMFAAIRANGNRPIPFIWFWPEGKQGAFILTHDVEEAAGKAFCPSLMDIDEEFGFKASFQIVPEERYPVEPQFLQSLRARGFEVCVHDLNHDGNLYTKRARFRRRAQRINDYCKKFAAQGFRSGALYRNPFWFEDFQFSYDMSVPNVAHLDPQMGGCCTIMPYFIGDILEIPVTESQDYTLFNILDQTEIDLWTKQTEIIVRGRGLISLISHPDYLIAEKPQETYRKLLAYLRKTCDARDIWATLPAEIDRWWRLRHKLKLVRVEHSWEIQGEGKERARIAYACIVDGRLDYTLSLPSQGFPAGPFPASRTTLSDAHAAQSLENPLERAEMPVLEHQDLSPEKAGLDTPAQAGKPQRPLRVCMVAYTFYESDNRVMRYAETLAKEGHEVEIFALQQGNSQREEALCGVKVHRLQGRLINEKTQFSYAWRILQFLLRAFYQVSKNDLKRKYDLVHVHSVPDFLVFTALLPRLRGTPVILDIHDILPEFYAGKFGSQEGSLVFSFLCYIERVSAKFATHVIIANHLWKKRLESRSVRPDKCSVVMNSPDPEIFKRSQRRPQKREGFLLMYPGTLNWHQGLDVAIKAFAKISAQVPKAEFHIYGEGPAKQHLTEMVKELGLESQVKFFDTRTLREVPKIIETADLGVVPKRKEGFGNEAFSTKIFEFMAMGVPVIVSDTRIDRYYFSDSVVRFFRGGDVDDLAHCMLDLIQHPEKRHVLVENAAEFVARNDWAAKKHEYLELVARLASGRASGTST